MSVEMNGNPEYFVPSTPTGVEDDAGNWATIRQDWWGINLDGTAAYGTLNVDGGWVIAGQSGSGPFTTSHEATKFSNFDGVMRQFAGSLEVTDNIWQGSHIDNIGGTVNIDNASEFHGTIAMASSGVTNVLGMESLTSIQQGQFGDILAMAGSKVLADLNINGSDGAGDYTIAHDPGASALTFVAGNYAAGPGGTTNAFGQHFIFPTHS